MSEGQVNANKERRISRPVINVNQGANAKQKPVLIRQMTKSKSFAVVDEGSEAAETKISMPKNEDTKPRSFTMVQ